MKKKQKKKQIIFLEAFPTITIYKMAKIFKENGYKTILIRLLEVNKQDQEFFKSAYSKTISLDLNFFKFHIKNFPLILFSLIKKSRHLFSSLISLIRLRPYVVIGRATPSWPAALLKILSKKTPLIYFPYDLRVLSYSTPEIAMKHGDLPMLEIKAERFCYENADGIMTKGDPEQLNHINGRMLGDNIKICPLQLEIQPYCSNDFLIPLNPHKLSKKDGEIHMVRIGSGGTPSKIRKSSTEDSFKELIKQKIHIHLYAKPVTKTKTSVKDFFKSQYGNFVDSKYFHIHDPLGPKEIVKEISKYDYLYWPQDTEINLKDNLDPLFRIGNKVATGLEAGIPMFYCDKYKFIDKLMKGYDLGLNSSSSRFKEGIKKLDYNKLIEKVKRARQDFLMEKHFERIEGFVHEVVRTKRLKNLGR